MNCSLSMVIHLILAALPLRAADPEAFLYAQMPNVTIRVQSRGSTSLLSLCQQQPAMISLVYSQCGGICYPFVYQLRDNLRGIGDADKPFRTLILSFDVRDTPEKMIAMADAVGMRDDSTWLFGTIDRREIQVLARSVGFEFTRDSLTGQLDHPPILIGLDRKGRIVRVIKKSDISRDEIWRLYRDIQGEYIPFSRSSGESLVSCFTYDARRGSIKVSWGFLLLYLPAALGALIVWRVFRAGRSADPCLEQTSPPRRRPMD